MNCFHGWNIVHTCGIQCTLLLYTVWCRLLAMGVPQSEPEGMLQVSDAGCARLC